MSTTKEAVSGAKRSYALDALRGYAILTMVLSAFVPVTLPAWMHHAQVPPPDFKFNPNLPGITWVDLVFPFFLFSMGAAFPLALSGRLEKGVPYWKIVVGVLARWFLLMGFAIYVPHTQFDELGYSQTVNYLLAILAFVLAFAALVRLPDSWKLWLRWGIKALGFAGAILFLRFVKLGGDHHFSMSNTDIIIQILADVSVFGALIWLISRQKILVRLGALGILMAFRLSAYAASGDPLHPMNWVGWLYTQSEKIPYFGLGIIQYLHIIIPATIVGDRILAWMKSRDEDTTNYKPWSTARLAGIVGLMVAFVVVMLVGLYTRLLWQTTVASLAMCALGWGLLSRPSNSTERLMSDIYRWGAYCLILGLAFEPYEGGIKKDSATMSYYYVTAGLAIFLLIAFTILIDVMKKKRWLQLLIDNGQNPMIAYIGRWTLVLPLLGLTGITPLLDRYLTTPWQQFAHGVISTLIIALVVSLFTRAKIFWRT